MSLLHFSKWKTFSILAAVIIGILFALPNALPADKRGFLPGMMQDTINLGLDLQGGAHMLLEVDSESVLTNEKRNQKDNMKSALRDAGVRFLDVREEGDNLVAYIRDGQDISKALSALKELEENLDGQIGAGKNVRVRQQGDTQIGLSITPENIDAIKERTIAQSIEVLRRRIDPQGTTEMTLAKEGEDRILLQVPGAKNVDEIKDRINKSANLSFHLVHDASDNAQTRDYPRRYDHATLSGVQLPTHSR